MRSYLDMNKSELSELSAGLQKKYSDFKAKGLKLDMSRGKPSADQLDISMKIFDVMDSSSAASSANGTDCRNYGILDGLEECRVIFGELLGVPSKNVIVGGNSSLNLMFDYIAQCMTHGAGAEPWSKLDKVKFACPAPGYDRHFSICEFFGIEMLIVPMNEDGPDMDVLEGLVKDSSVKGMFCVPKYSNPKGNTFSDEVVRRIAKLSPAASDFRIIWDNAYCVHDINDTPDTLLNIYEECLKNSTEDMVVQVTSTSKISFPGSGISAIAVSDRNLAMIKKRLSMQTIGYDKINQLRHVLYFKDAKGIKQHMELHKAIIAPKFKTVLNAFNKEFTGLGIASWTEPSGGYFISLDVLPGCAKRVVELCEKAGVVLTPAGATFPKGFDPEDKNIRIAPTFPPVSELEVAVEILCVSVKLAAAEKLLKE